MLFRNQKHSIPERMQPMNILILDTGKENDTRCLMIDTFIDETLAAFPTPFANTDPLAGSVG